MGVAGNVMEFINGRKIEMKMRYGCLAHRVLPTIGQENSTSIDEEANNS